MSRKFKIVIADAEWSDEEFGAWTLTGAAKQLGIVIKRGRRYRAMPNIGENRTLDTLAAAKSYVLKSLATAGKK